MKQELFYIGFVIILFDYLLAIYAFNLNDFFKYSQNQQTVSDRNRFFKFDLIPNSNDLNIITKRPWRNQVPNRRRDFQKWKQQRQGNQQYVWDDYGKFWTYRNRLEDNSDYFNNDIQNFRNAPCQPPFCYPRRCQEIQCGQPNCITAHRICHRHSVECDIDQKQVLFGSEVVCVKKASDDSCSPNCGDNGLCIKGKCYCETGYYGDRCLIMETELCKRKKQLTCIYGCSFDKRINSHNCVCGEKESRTNCIDVRICEKECKNGGNCKFGKCQCSDGFDGDECQFEIGSCSPGQMGNRTCQQICVSEGRDKFQCKCQVGYYLNNDGKTCSKQQCFSIGTLQTMAGKCKCRDGWRGELCNEDVDECSEKQICHQICTNNPGSYKCSCIAGFHLQTNGICMRTCANNCSGKGDCLNGLCYCFKGWHGEDCSMDIDECKYSHGCEQQCVNTPGSFHCSCFQGSILQTNGKNCYHNTCQPECQNGGLCINSSCVCKPGFTGLHCESLDICKALLSCEHHCNFVGNSFVCTCRPGFTLMSDGKSCVKCKCFQGRCVNGSCICNAGFIGSDCNEDIDECSLRMHRCEHNCVNTIGSYSCTCNRNYKLMLDGKSCERIECPNCRGQCINNICVCLGGFRGINCEVDINECENKNICQHYCTNTNGSFFCSCRTGYHLDSDGKSCLLFSNYTCPTGFKGNRCDEDIDECTSGQHKCEQLCYNTVGSYHCGCIVNYTISNDGRSCRSDLCSQCKQGKCEKDGFCKCNRGFKGKNCDQDVDECKLWRRSCEHNCTNTYGSYRCLCQPGYFLSADQHSCISFCSLCKNGKCDHNGQCKCKTGWTGPLCDQDVDECSSHIHDCEHHCINTNGSYSCICQPPLHLSTLDGKSCIRKIANCSKPCTNGGKCVNKKCVCKAGFKGDSCEEDINECLLPFKNHGCIMKCRNTFGGYECICPPGYVVLDDQKTCKISPKDTMCKPHCLNGGVCRDMSRCYCPTAFEGIDCGIDVNECTRYAPCDKVHGICQNTFGSYYCQCASNYVLMFDGVSCMTISEAILSPHLRYRGRGTKGVTRIIEN